jgi:hypothetical protein
MPVGVTARHQRRCKQHADDGSCCTLKYEGRVWSGEKGTQLSHTFDTVEAAVAWREALGFESSGRRLIPIEGHPGIYRRGGRFAIRWNAHGKQHQASAATLEEAEKLRAEVLGSRNNPITEFRASVDARINRQREAYGAALPHLILAQNQLVEIEAVAEEDAEILWRGLHDKDDPAPLVAPKSSGVTKKTPLPTKKCCPRCQETLPVTKFNRRFRNGRMHPSSWCKACMRDYHAEQRHLAQLGKLLTDGRATLSSR